MAGTADSLTLRVSLIVATRDRSWQLERLFQSLAQQSLAAFEVIVVDQNADDRVAPLVDQALWPFPVRHVRQLGRRGASAARNAGAAVATAPVLLFPDDDAWYPAGFLASGLNAFEARGLRILTGRSADLEGRSINGRFATTPGAITVANVWVRQQEWILFIDRRLFAELGGFDEAVGVGALSPWQAAEGPDLIIRALKLNAACWYDPQLIGHHDELPAAAPDVGMLSKARAYGRGMGHVLAKHHAGLSSLAYWLLRPAAGMALNAITGRRARARFFAAMLVGRWEGWRGRATGDAASDAGGGA